MMELAKKLACHGFKVTFVNTDFIHSIVMDAWTKNEDVHDEGIHQVSIPDGLELSDTRTNFGQLCDAMQRVMPQKLEELIEKMIYDNMKIKCVFADNCMSWALGVARKMGIQGFTFCSSPATTLALFSTIPKLIDNGIIDSNDGELSGSILRQLQVHLSPKMPAMSTATFPWVCFPNLGLRKSAFKYFVSITEDLKYADVVISNSSEELEPDTFSSFPDLLPVGPLSASNRLGNQGGNFWPEDLACLSWLINHQSAPSFMLLLEAPQFMIKKQVQEIALGLELTGRPFLWVLRPGTNKKEFEELAYCKEQIEGHGRVVSWAPQEKVLRHSSVAYFMSHCGWNSTIQGISNGVPFLCWPYFADQFLNERFICDAWKVGLGLGKDENIGLVKKEEILKTVNQLLSDTNYKSKAMDMKEKLVKSVNEGSSRKNWSNIIEWIKK